MLNTDGGTSVSIALDVGGAPADRFVCEVLGLIGGMAPRGSRTVVVTEAVYNAWLKAAGGESERNQRPPTLQALLRGLDDQAQLERGCYRLLALTYGSKTFQGYVLLTWHENLSELAIRFIRPWARLPARYVAWTARVLRWHDNVSYWVLLCRLRVLRLVGWKPVRPAAESRR
jgi:hypothetical protein